MSADAAMEYPKMKPAEVRKVLRQWMKELPNPRPATTWRKVSERTSNNGVISEWATSDRTALLNINVRSGELISYRISAHPNPKILKMESLD
jgi:hypothetical protein